MLGEGQSHEVGKPVSLCPASPFGAADFIGVAVKKILQLPTMALRFAADDARVTQGFMLPCPFLGVLLEDECPGLGRKTLALDDCLPAFSALT